MKKFIAFILSIIVAFSFTSCGKEKTELYCYNCGNGMDKSDYFCASCGTPAIKNDSTSATEPETTTELLTTTESTTTVTTTKPTTTKAPTVSEPVIPDPGLYFGLARLEDSLFSYGTDYDYYHGISYKTDLNYPQALQEYIAVISEGKYQFELINTYENTTFSPHYHYYFKYTGGQDIPHVSHYKYKKLTCDSSCDLVVNISYFPDDNYAYLSLEYSPDAPFKLVDPGKRTSFILKDLSYLS